MEDFEVPAEWKKKIRTEIAKIKKKRYAAALGNIKQKFKTNL